MDDFLDEDVSTDSGGGGLAQASSAPFVPEEESGIPSWMRSGLQQMREPDITPAIIKLEQAGRQVPGNQLIDQFRDQTVALLPKLEELQQARLARQQAAERMLQGVGSPYEDPRVAWSKFAAGMLRPTRTGAFAESLGYGMEGWSDAIAKRQEAMRQALQRKAELTYNVANADEQDLLKRAQYGMSGLKSLATLEALQQRLSRPGAMSDLEKRVRALGLDPLTPAGRKMMIRLNYMQNGTPEVKAVVAGYPDLDPESPDFAKLVQKEMDRKADTMESRINASDAATRAANARADAAAQALDDERNRGKALGPDPQLAFQLGIPVSVVNPYAKLTGKARETLYQNNEKAWTKEKEDLGERVTKATSFETDAKRALELLPQIQTGPVYNVPGSQIVASAFSPAAGELRSISNRITPQLRVVGSGATSDFEQRMMLSSTIGLDKLPEVNRNIALGYIAYARRLRDYRDYKEKYFSANGHTKGFDELWKQYVDDEPFLEKNSKPDELHIRPKALNFTAWAKKKGLFGENP